MKRAIGLVLLLSACGGPPASTGTTTAANEHPNWAAMSHEQRGQFMAEVVIPRMRPMFQTFDAQAYGEFGCATCHGANAHDVAFHMPNTLYPLNPSEIPGFMTSTDERRRRYAEFMAHEVTPTMTELLGAQPFDMQTHQGFGCLNCHATATASN